MKRNRNRALLLSAFSILAACAFAYTTGNCVTSYATCNLSQEGAQCGGGTGTISFGPQVPVGLLYCGGNSPGRCGGPNSPGTCSELLYRPGLSQMVYCGDQELGYCFDSLGAPQQTGYDCGLNPCADVPPAQRWLPTIIGNEASPSLATPYFGFPVPAQ